MLHTSSCKVLVILVRFLTILEFFRRIFEKYSNMKFYQNQTSGSRAVAGERTDIMTVIVAFRNFPKASKICFNE